VGLPNGLQIFHELVCVGLGFPFARHVPDGFLSRSAAFRGGVVFQAGTPPKKECVSLFIRKEDQHSEDRLLAKAWSKDYIYVREKVASRQLVRRESAHDANITVTKAKWPKSGVLLNDLHPKAGSAVTSRLPLNS
jgi:hypothetical protein